MSRMFFLEWVSMRVSDPILVMCVGLASHFYEDRVAAVG